MSSAGEGAVVDDGYLQSMKISRNSTAVLKHGLITLRSEVGDLAIFVFEGVDDKIVYHHWINRIRADLEYEPYVCEGKKYVLRLLQAVNSDLNGLRERVYFFVDKDFDEMAEHPDCDNLFVTDCYAVENYLVDAHTFKGVMRTHFHCGGGVKRRDRIVEFYSEIYSAFLEVTKEINFRTFASRKLRIGAVLPDKASKIATINLLSVEPLGLDVKQIVRLDREPTENEERALRQEFDKLNAANHYRGKYAYMFYKRWIDLAIKDRNADENSELFNEVKTNAKATTVSLDCLAAKSSMPKGLKNFIKVIEVA
nr:DUF4435 domain-containing protein [uncultured Pseudomonas sp.]